MKKTKNEFLPKDETLLFHILHQEEKGSVKPTARQFNSVAVAMKSNDVSKKSDKRVASKMRASANPSNSSDWHKSLSSNPSNPSNSSH